MQLTDTDYRRVIESIADYAVFILDPDGIVQSWNPGAERIKGYTPAEIIGRHFSQFYTPGDRANHVPERGLERARATGKFEDVGWRVRKDGTRFWANVVLTALRDEHGRLIGFAKVTRDLTDHAYRAFVEATNGIIWTTDASGQPNADSPSWRAFTGQTETEWRERRAFEPVHPEDRPGLQAAWPAARSRKEPFVAEFRLRRHDGVYVWMSLRAVPFLDQDGAIREWFGVTVDISARKAAEEARERAANWLATTLRSIGDGVIATDDHGRIVFMNAVAEALTGVASDESRGKSLSEVFPILNENTRQPVANPVDTVLREGVVVGLANHTVLVRRDGREIPIDDSAAPIRTADGRLDGVVLVFRDATHEKQETARRAFLARAGEELMEAADYRQALARIADLAVPRLADWCSVEIAVDGQRETELIAIAHVDPAKVAFARELNRRYPPDRDAATGVPNVLRTGRSELYEDIPRELLDRAAVDDEHRRVIRELDLRSAMVVPLRGRDRTFGALSFIYTGARRYTADDLALAEELARRAAIVVERRRLEDEARVANRAKDEFLAMLGHELRNPLAPIRTALELMDAHADPRTARERAVIARQVDHLVTLVDDLLDVSRITSEKLHLELRPIDIGEVIASALETASPLLEERRHHVTVSVSGPLVVAADPKRLAQVFSNLLNNAAKFTQPGGEISVSATRDGDEVAVTVRDNGVGISPEVLPSVFEMFVQERQSIERAHGGLGLGLNIVRGLVSMHGGSVAVHSEGRGKGSSFTVLLPASANAPAAPAAPEAAPLAGPTGKRRILLVDDNEDAVMLMSDLLSHLGYETRVALDGGAALAAAVEFRPEIALLDIGLPVMNGYDLARELRARLGAATPRMIAVTGYGQDKDQELARAAGFDRHLTKPVSVELLRRTIDELAG